jgi:hypothetical protein
MNLPLDASTVDPQPAAAPPAFSAKAGAPSGAVAPQPAQATPVEFPQQDLRLRVDEETHEVIAMIVDPKTDAVIREIPSPDMKEAARVIRSILGRLVDKLV